MKNILILLLAFVLFDLNAQTNAVSSFSTGAISQNAEGGQESYYVDVTFTMDSLSGFLYTKAFQIPAFDGVDWSKNPPMVYKKTTSTYKSAVGFSAWLIGCYVNPTDTAAAGSGMVLDTLVTANVNETDSSGTFFCGAEFQNQKTARWYRIKMQNVSGTNYGDINSGRLVLYFPARKEQK